MKQDHIIMQSDWDFNVIDGSDKMKIETVIQIQEFIDSESCDFMEE